MKILISDKLDASAVELLKQQPGYEVIEKIGMTHEELIKEIVDYDAIIVRSATKVKRDVIEAAKNLKVIGRSGVGLDNIDLEAAKEKNITVVNSPLATSRSVAEHAISLMFAIYKNLTFADSTMKNGEWAKKKIKNIELADKTLGVIGGGAIGRNVIAIAKALGMNILVHDAFDLHKDLVEMGLKNSSLEELLKNSDIITLHIPKTPETTNLIDKKEFEMMKDNAVIINTARGGIINETALYEALESGKLLGAGLDVFETEPVKSDDKLTKHPKVVATPHIAGSTKEGQKRASLETVNRVIESLK